MAHRYRLHADRNPGARCAWCWAAFAADPPHYRVEPTAGTALSLHFHPGCWEQYRGLSPAHLSPEGPDETWTPARVEATRIALGLGLNDFAARIGTNADRYSAFLAGGAPLSLGMRAKLATLTAGMRAPPTMRVDWVGRPTAFFSLCVHKNWTVERAARELGVGSATVRRWYHAGVPATTPTKLVAKLHRAAEVAGFGPAEIVEHRLWTVERLREAVSRATKAAFAAAAGCTPNMIGQLLAGKHAVTRAMAGKLTRAAVAVGASLPPKGVVPKSTRVKNLLTGGPRKPRRTRWTPERVAQLGTMTDMALAREMGLTFGAVSKKRAAMGIPPFDRDKRLA